jgi:amino acid adenylation domain-containing protein
MKISEYSLLDERQEDDLLHLIRRFNQTASEYPRDKTTHRIFSEQAAKTPQNVAAIYEGSRMSYAELERRSNILAHVLVHRGIQPEEFVAVMLDRSLEMIVALLGILKAGAAYVPLSLDTPYERLRYMLTDTRIRLLLSEKRYIKHVNKLQWDCPDLEAFLCVDSHDVHGEIEEASDMMDRDMWEYIAREAFDDISGGGWKDSYTGEWLSRDVMDAYGENIYQKLSPLLSAHSRVLEIGCASGISMFRLAPLVALYYGTDLSRGIVRWTDREAKRRGLTNIKLTPLAAHEIDQVEEKNFGVVILNSVIECFSGHNYLRDVLRKSIDLMPDEGYLFLGNVWDQDLKPAFVQSLLEFKRQNPGRGYRTKIDRAAELFIAKGFLEDLRFDFPEIAAIEYSTMLGSAESELSQFGYDALIRIEKRQAHPPPSRHHKYQYDRRMLQAFPDAALPERTGPHGLAYLMYTSGTSGQPKGVMIEHRSILRLILNTNYIQLDPADRVLQTGALGFDASTFEIWGPLLSGGCVVLPPGKSFLNPKDLARLIRGEGITTLFLTTGLFNQLVEIDLHLFQGLKTLLTGGETASVHHFNSVRTAHPRLALKHVYGPTENTTFSSCYDVATLQERTVPIGKPIANTTAYILDQSRKLVPVGVPGELCVGGDGLSRGYWNDPELTRRRFIPHPFEPGALLYCSGDLARWLPDGNIEFIGRIDTQVKVRGYRIELEEIETCFLQHELVSEAAAVAKDFGRGGTELVAYIASPHELSLDDLRDYAKSVLPEYMIPSSLIHLEKLPLNANGKVDRHALPAPDLGQSLGTDAVPAATPAEKHLAAIWEQVLGHTHIGVTSDFFELGGHSLKVTKLVSLIQREMGVDVPLTVVFRAPTIRELARYMADVSRVDRRLIDEKLVLLNKPSDHGKIFAFPPGSGYCLAYLQLANLLPYPFYGLSFIEDDTRLQEYVELIEEAEPNGPYVLFGYSSGGKLAFRVAQELEKAGHQVSYLVLVDSARYLRKVHFSEEGLQEIAAEFLEHVTSEVLREKALIRMRQYRRFLGESVESGTIQGDIHLIVAPDSQQFVHDPTGGVIATLLGWQEMTRGRFQVYAGDGNHREMLTPPHLERNVELLKKILESTPTSTRR